MKKSIKFAALALAIAIAAAAAVSCGVKNDGKSSDTDTDTGVYATADGTDTAAPDTDVPDTDAPDTDAPDTDAPDTDAPDTDAPDMDAPDTDAPVTGADTEPADPVMGDHEAQPLRYVALGDSIAYGQGLADPEGERYSALVEAALDASGIYDCESFNYGINGLQSGGLIDDIADNFAPELNGADVVTVSIGANNVLSPSVSMLTQYAINLLVGDETRRGELNSELYKNFRADTDAGIAEFERDLPNLIALIRVAAPDARIIFQTIYNPYAGVSLTLDFSVEQIAMATLSDELVTRLDDIIKDNADKLGYEVVDIYAAFSGEDGVVNAGSGIGSSPFSNLDPHPTAKGHRIIADAITDMLLPKEADV